MGLPVQVIGLKVTSDFSLLEDRGDKSGVGRREKGENEIKETGVDEDQI